MTLSFTEWVMSDGWVAERIHSTNLPASGGPPATPKANKQEPSPNAAALRFSSTVKSRSEFIVVTKIPSPIP